MEAEECPVRKDRRVHGEGGSRDLAHLAAGGVEVEVDGDIDMPKQGVRPLPPGGAGEQATAPKVRRVQEREDSALHTPASGVDGSSAIDE